MIVIGGLTDGTDERTNEGMESINELNGWAENEWMGGE